MGGGATGISVFFKKHLIYADSVRMGGDHVSSDISMGLQIPTASAERLKTLHGGAMAMEVDDREMIETGGNSGDWEHDRRQVSRSELIGIIRPRIEEILEDVRDRLDAAGFDNLHRLETNRFDRRGQSSSLDSTVWRRAFWATRSPRSPIRVQGLPQAATDRPSLVWWGLALNAAHPQDEWWDFEVPQPQFVGRPLRRACGGFATIGKRPLW